MASSNPSIFSDPTFTNSQDHQPLSSDTELQEECPISIIPAPTKSSTKASEQVQMDTTEYTATEKETIQMDQDIGDSLIVEDQLRPPSVIFLDSPNGDLEGQSNNPSPLPHTTFEIENEKKQAKPTTIQVVTSKQLYTQQRATLQAECQVYMLLPPMSPYK